MKRPHPLPPGCHDANSAALLLGISKRRLLAHMRELGWIDIRDGVKNMPRRDLEKKGLMTTQARDFCLKGQPDIIKQYPVMLLTQAGFQVLKKIIQLSDITAVDSEKSIIVINASPAYLPRNPINVPVKVAQFNQYTANIERQKCLQHIDHLYAPDMNGKGTH